MGIWATEQRIQACILSRDYLRFILDHLRYLPGMAGAQERSILEAMASLEEMQQEMLDNGGKQE